MKKRFVLTVDLDEEKASIILGYIIPELCDMLMTNVSCRSLDKLSELSKEEILASLNKVPQELVPCPHCENGTSHPNEAAEFEHSGKVH